MTTLFPGAVDSYSVKVDNVTDVMAAHVNDLQDAVVAIETAVIAQAPKVREKPFLYVDAAGKYFVRVPALRENASGTTWSKGPAADPVRLCSVFVE